jgi:hypothetical protein
MNELHIPYQNFVRGVHLIHAVSVALIRQSRRFNPLNSCDGVQIMDPVVVCITFSFRICCDFKILFYEHF